MELRYAEPATETGAATIQGSEHPVKLIIDDYTVYVLNIDGKRVMAGREGWKTPIRVTEGHHTITTEFQHGAFVTTADIEIEAKSGQKYQVLFETNKGMYPHYCDFWVFDEISQKPISAVVRGHINGVPHENYAPIFIPVVR